LKNIPAFLWVLFILILLVVSYFLSPVSYFFVTFKQPMTTAQFIDYLDDNKINPAENDVFVLNCALSQPEGISKLDFIARKGNIITDAVFNTKPYAFKALFDSRVKRWYFSGPRHPYD
jgi:hypothetical protein